MNTRIKILEVCFDSLSMEQTVKKAMGYLETNKANTIYTANPEIVMLAEKDTNFREIINQGDLITADGIGIVIGSKWIKKPLPERVAGYDLVQNTFDKIKNTGKTVYFFGAAPNIAKTAAENMMERHKGLKIVGTHDGYFNKEEENKIIEEINNLKPDILLVGLGAPKQEIWIHEHKNSLNVKLMIGVGGSFDIMSGNLKRAPKIFIRLGLEWFYRLITQPTRIKRMIKLPVFLIHVLKNR